MPLVQTIPPSMGAAQVQVAMKLLMSLLKQQREQTVVLDKGQIRLVVAGINTVLAVAAEAGMAEEHKLMFPIRTRPIDKKMAEVLDMFTLLLQLLTTQVVAL